MGNKIKNIDKATERIKKAVSNKERIILYGDSDLDGVSSVIILEEAIKNLGGEVCAAVFPDRENDGYGINEKALEFLKDKSPALFITLDLGIGNIKEVETAKKFGFEVIIVDHHEPLNGVPDTPIIVNPKQKDDDYPFKGLANAGIALKLSLEILGDKISENLKKGFFELAALATIADMVPQVDGNKEILEEGLSSFENTFRPALRAFLDILNSSYRSKEETLQRIISALGAAESKDYKNEAYFLLTCPDFTECREMAQSLIDKYLLKQRKIKEIAEEVERRISKKPDSPIIFEGDIAWKLILAGPVASIMCQKYQKPTFIFKKGGKESCGSVRTQKGVNSVEAMKTCQDILLTFGGHAQASGFRLKNENLEKFEKCLEKYFEK